MDCVIHLLIPYVAVHVCNFLKMFKGKVSSVCRSSGLKRLKLTERRVIGIPCRVVGPMPSTFFGGACVDVILLDSSNLLSLVSLLKSRLME